MTKTNANPNFKALPIVEIPEPKDINACFLTVATLYELIEDLHGEGRARRLFLPLLPLTSSRTNITRILNWRLRSI